MKRALVLTVAMTLLAACTKEEPKKEAMPEPPGAESDAKSEDPPTPEGPAKLTVIHAGTGIDTVQFLVNGKVLEGSEPFDSFDGSLVRFEVPSGDHVIAVGQASDEEAAPPPLVSRVVSLSPTASYIVLIAGAYGKREGGDRPLGLFLLNDVGGELEDGAVSVRTIHGVSNAPPMDILGHDALKFVNVGFGKGSAFHPAVVGPELLKFRSGLKRDAEPFYMSKNIVLAAGEQTTLLLLGKMDSKDHPLRLWALTPNAEVARSL